MNNDIDKIDYLLKKLDKCDSSMKLSLLTDAINYYPENPKLLLLLAGFQVQNQKFDLAEATYIDILRISPNYTIARFQLGLLRFTSGRPATAFATWKPLDQLDERDFLRLFKRAFEYLAQDQFDAAILCLRQGIACNTTNLPLNEDMRLLAARILKSSGVKDENIDGMEADRPEKNTNEGQASDHASEAHFLVSSYRNLH
jgi:tetratricopeptide (TPR) repeat protein